MAARQISATVNEDVYQEFEALRLKLGQKRSEAVEQAIQMWVKHCSDALIAEGCKATQKEDLALARASKKTALRALSRNL